MSQKKRVHVDEHDVEDHDDEDHDDEDHDDDDHDDDDEDVAEEMDEWGHRGIKGIRAAPSRRAGGQVPESSPGAPPYPTSSSPSHV